MTEKDCPGMQGSSWETKAQLELKSAQDVNTKKNVRIYFGNKRKMKKDVDTLFEEVRDLLKHSMEKAVVLSAFFVSVLISRVCSEASQVPCA